MEAAETLEEAVRREAFEETGIVINRVAYHSSQPWVKLSFEYNILPSFYFFFFTYCFFSVCQCM